MSIGNTRLEDTSIFNYIKYRVLGYSFIEQLSSQPLVYDSTLGIYMPSYSGLEPSPVSAGRGWVPFDEVSGCVDTTHEQALRVSVTGASSYTVNYFLGGIKNPNTVPTYVSYYWNYISVIDGWPLADPPPLPIVVIDTTGESRTGLQLGGGHISKRPAFLYVFATSKAERDDITDVLYNALFNKSIPMLDYSTGDYVDYEGLFNNSFSPTPVTGVGLLYFEDVTSRNVSAYTNWSDLNKFRSVLSFSVVSYKD